MKEQLQALRAEAEARFAAAASYEELEAARVEFLGRKGRLRRLSSGVRDLPPEERPDVGRLINEVTRALESAVEAARERIESGREPVTEAIDVTLPGRSWQVGRIHPLNATLQEIINIFLGMGFAVMEGPEVDDYYHSFEALNYPEDHPAMDEQATFYVTPRILLRSQTSTVQIRTMEKQQPPIRIVAAGRCYRRDTTDATHLHTFHQIEGLLVDRGVTFADLKGTLLTFARQLFGPECQVRFRPDFFPFTEPSAEVAFTCFLCGGKGCRVCSRTGWLEVAGAGMVDPNVLRNVGYDPEVYTGFAFGFGIERIAMLRHGIDDIRRFYESEMRFLKQF